MLRDVVLGWLGRRVPDWGGWLGIVGTVLFSVFDVYRNLSVSDQEAIGQLLQGNWKTVTLAAAVSLVSVVWSQVKSFKATVAPQVVTPDGKKADFQALPPSTRAKVQIEAKKLEPAPKPHPLDAFKKVFTRND